MAKQPEQLSPIPSGNSRLREAAVFTRGEARQLSFRERVTSLIEKLRRDSHKQYEYMPSLLKVEELVWTILAQNERLQADQDGKITLQGNEKQYLVGYETPQGVIEAGVAAVYPERSSLTITREIGEKKIESELDPSQELRFTMMKDIASRKRPSA